MKLNQRFLAATLKPKTVAALVASSAILSVGCANMVTTAPHLDTLSAGSSFGGTVHGGNQPVYNASVRIYEAGQTGVGSASTLLATTTTDINGAFQFTKLSGTAVQPSSGSSYTCPTNTGSDGLLYIVSYGGNTTGSGDATQNNSAAVFMAPLGLCGTVSSSTYVNISEVTTVSLIAATAQFINPTSGSIGNDGIGAAYQALIRAFNTVPNLVSNITGLAKTSTATTGSASGYNVSAVTVTATPQTAKLNTIANILSSCINQVSASGANCTALFANATPPVASRTSQPSITYPMATSTFQAALYMFLNPTDGSTANRTALFNLVSANAPFQPTLTALPTDWTIAINYSTTDTCGANSSSFFSNPYDLNIDVNGSVWVSNNASSNGSLVGLSSSGTPVSCVSLGVGSRGDAVDINNNIWYGDATTNKLYRFNPSTNAVLTYNTLYPVLAITTDGAGNIFYTSVSGTTGYVFKIFDGADNTLPSTSTVISQVVGPVPARIFPDAAGDLWVTSGSNFVTEVSAATGGTNFLNNYISTPFTVQSPTYGVVVGPANRVFVTSQDPSATLTVLTPSGSTYAVASGFPTSANTAGLSNPAGIFIDGATNSWIANLAAQTATGNYSLSEIAMDGTALSAGGNANGGFQKSAIYLNVPRQPVIDLDGNVWVTNDGSTSSITEFVGAAVPIYAPYSVGLQNGRFQMIP